MNLSRDQATTPPYQHIPLPMLSQQNIQQRNSYSNAAKYCSQPPLNIPIYNPKQSSPAEYPPLPNHQKHEWQTVHYGKKRNRNSEETGDRLTQNKKQAYWLDQPTPTHNRYENLPTEEMETTTANTNKEPKPPPIYVTDVKHIQPLIQLLNELAKDSYITKTIRHDQVKIQPLKSEVYSTILKALMEKNTEFHTYKPQKDKTFRVVLKTIHPSTDLKEITHSLAEEGHEVTNIWNVKQFTPIYPCHCSLLTLRHKLIIKIYTTSSYF